MAEARFPAFRETPSLPLHASAWPTSLPLHGPRVQESHTSPADSLLKRLPDFVFAARVLKAPRPLLRLTSRRRALGMETISKPFVDVARAHRAMQLTPPMMRLTSTMRAQAQ
jgi:hypothetical protein